MKKINVIIKEKTILELAEDAQKGDVIDLKEITKVDTSFIESMIESQKDKVYLERLNEAKKLMEEKNNSIIEKYEQQLKSLREQNNTELKLEQERIKSSYIEKINELTKKIELLESTKEQQIENIKLGLDKTYQDKLIELDTKTKLDLLNKDNELESLKITLNQEKENALLKQKEQFLEQIKEKDDLINKLNYQKVAMGSKVIGEKFETWCNNEVESYMQNGLFNCTWTKDNTVVTNEGDEKGSKADYIFNVYASPEHLEEELLASVCVEMKDENPNSTKKQENSKFYKKLNENREKKNCKYALLVSNLESDNTKFVNIYKVPGYNDMYVVRPENMMSFLNMIVSLTTRFANLIESNKLNKLELKTKLELIEQFDQIKEKLLNKPLEDLTECIDAIIRSTETITKANNNILKQCDNINRKYINKINKNIIDFDLKLDKKIFVMMND